MKRIIDLSISLLVLLLLSAIFPLAYSLHILITREKFIFKQIRIGKDGAPFICYKIRSIFISKNKMTLKYGKFIRKYKFDELPQFYNVLMGEMSIVGPRPLMPGELEHYITVNPKVIERQRKTPGITGLSQIIVKEEAVKTIGTINDKIYYDNYYCDNSSLLLDLKIIFQTLIYILTQKHIDYQLLMPDNTYIEKDILKIVNEEENIEIL